MTVSVIKPVEGLRYVQIRAEDGYRVLVPIDENRWQGVQQAEAFARKMLARRSA
jgi:hypothetical protein